MTTLGKALQVNTYLRRKDSYLPPGVTLSRFEIARVQALIEAFRVVTERAKAAIISGIAAGQDEFNIHYDVKERESDENSAYGYLKRHTDSLFKNDDDAYLHPVWGAFLAWADAQDLRVRLDHHWPSSMDGIPASGHHVRISAFPSPFN